MERGPTAKWRLCRLIAGPLRRNNAELRVFHRQRPGAERLSPVSRMQGPCRVMLCPGTTTGGEQHSLTLGPSRQGVRSSKES